MPPQLLSKNIMSLTKPVFQRKYMKLGRIYSYWAQIIGEDFAATTLPIALQTKPVKNKTGKSVKEDGPYKIEATLHIMTDGASALALSYQKDLILGRLEHLFGERMVTDLRITQNHIKQKAPASKPHKLSPQEKEELVAMIDCVEDPDLKQRLSQFATSLLQSGRA
ncbi:MAG: DUF721 domain-containing protein [Rhodospirillales bacterium]|nr:DUF721 domain-containing protein [Rhodospirillales bacterium]MCB9979993.1 DUF721 domain-containing protein [Rhodospirillales bacterium]